MMTRDIDEPGATRPLSEEECWRVLAAAPYGRIAASVAQEIDIYPINHFVVERAIVFRTSPGTKLLELTIHRSVAFEVDGFDRDEAFSVVVKGDATEVERSAEIEAFERRGLESWAPEAKDRWVRITPRTVSGRVFSLAHAP
ncbi:pyridoxamine 5'-phosphate oxidase family protein [Microbacterium hatanonis]|uniref:Pyridoxamine 5'-phosphate oxidase family protein n=1 Tax=Microbacterium hatanonis TaxID=404366 RepID=A0A5C8I3P7_9MICO|nr:pyridoxamine 5'-phosphate oxidase family protein [Microbacterium hatanonis]TXK12654.1 pyridoxamine 5'-phosphate oxidase family protein [Microbacterium hatanonis]